MLKKIKFISLLTVISITLLGCKSVLQPFFPYLDLAHEISKYSLSDIQELIKVDSSNPKKVIYKAPRTIVDYNPDFVLNDGGEIQKEARIISEKNTSTGKIKHVLYFELMIPIRNENYFYYTYDDQFQIYNKKYKAKLLKSYNKRCNYRNAGNISCDVKKYKLDVTKFFKKFKKRGMKIGIISSRERKKIYMPDYTPLWLPKRYFKAISRRIKLN